MSHYTQIKTQLVSARHIVRALADLGFDRVEVHAAPVPLVGFQGDLRENHAEIVIRRKFVGMGSNDIGFCRDEEGKFQAIISDFDRRNYDESWLANLSKRYSYHVTKEVLEEKGFELVEEGAQGTEIHLTLRRVT